MNHFCKVCGASLEGLQASAMYCGQQCRFKAYYRKQGQAKTAKRSAIRNAKRAEKAEAKRQAAGITKGEHFRGVRAVRVPCCLDRACWLCAGTNSRVDLQRSDRNEEKAQDATV